MKKRPAADGSTDSPAQNQLGGVRDSDTYNNLNREIGALSPGLTLSQMFDAFDEQMRRRLIRISKVDFPLEVVKARDRLDALYRAFVRDGNHGKAFEVLREQNKLLSVANHLEPLRESDLWDERRDPYFQAVRELDPADRYEAGRKRQLLDEELKRSAFEKTGRNPDGSKKMPAAGSSDSDYPDETREPDA